MTSRTRATSPSPTSLSPGAPLPLLRALACCATLALLAACASNQGDLSATQEAAQYQARARRTYTPPGPRSDPWGPYITEASQRFDIPEAWIRQVMKVESSGKVMDTSSVGAMGLMQVMPETYDGLRARYDLGDDPYEPRDNLLAGTGYLREMYDVYGFPGFLAAYNAGPHRLDDYLTRNRPLPDETRNYVRKIGPYIAGIEPNRPSAASGYAMNQVPLNIPPGPRYPQHQRSPVALAENRRGTTAARAPVQTASLPEPRHTAPAAPPALLAAASPPQRTGFHLIPQAAASTLPVQRTTGAGGTTGNWAIQVGAFGNEHQARAAADAARGQAHGLLASAHPAVGTVRQANTTLYRARVTGLSRDAAVQACEKLSRGRGACIVLSPEAQS